MMNDNFIDKCNELKEFINSLPKEQYGKIRTVKELLTHENFKHSPINERIAVINGLASQIKDSDVRNTIEKLLIEIHKIVN